MCDVTLLVDNNGEKYLYDIYLGNMIESLCIINAALLLTSLSKKSCFMETYSTVRVIFYLEHLFGTQNNLIRWMWNKRPSVLHDKSLKFSNVMRKYNSVVGKVEAFITFG